MTRRRKERLATYTARFISRVKVKLATRRGGHRHHAIRTAKANFFCVCVEAESSLSGLHPLRSLKLHRDAADHDRHLPLFVVVAPVLRQVHLLERSPAFRHDGPLVVNLHRRRLPSPHLKRRDDVRCVALHRAIVARPAGHRHDIHRDVTFAQLALWHEVVKPTLALVGLGLVHVHQVRRLLLASEALKAEAPPPPWHRHYTVNALAFLNMHDCVEERHNWLSCFCSCRLLSQKKKSGSIDWLFFLEIKMYVDELQE